MLSAQVYDIIDATCAALRAAALQSVDEVRKLPEPLVRFSVQMRTESTGPQSASCLPTFTATLRCWKSAC